jgi:hypothetical protein
VRGQPGAGPARLRFQGVEEPLHGDRAGRVPQGRDACQLLVGGCLGVPAQHLVVPLGRGGVVGHDRLPLHARLGQGEGDHGACAVFPGGAVHEGGAVAVGDEPQRRQDRVGPLEQEPEVEAGEPAAHRGPALRQWSREVVLLGKQRQVGDGDQRLPGHRSRAFGRYLDTGPQVGDRPYAVAVDKAAHVGRRQVLQAVRPEQPAADGPAPVGGRQAAGVAGIGRAVKVDPVRFHPSVHSRPHLCTSQGSHLY